ncbi:MAG: hydrogenase maturation nickel metallochaperone HypA [Planctomycetaceae bacterium]|nr:hydrogenase maturation nickel metallochaperone HypA [Planctomycetaceae bacterium]
MHELSIVDALIEQVKETLDRSDERGRVLRLELRIGRLSGVSSQSLRFAVELLAPGTSVEGAEVVIREPKAVCNCHACHAQVEIDELVVECPKCGSDDVSIEGGRDLILQSIEVEE